MYKVRSVSSLLSHLEVVIRNPVSQVTGLAMPISFQSFFHACCKLIANLSVSASWTNRITVEICSARGIYCHCFVSSPRVENSWKQSSLSPPWVEWISFLGHPFSEGAIKAPVLRRWLSLNSPPPTGPRPCAGPLVGYQNSAPGSWGSCTIRPQQLTASVWRNLGIAISCRLTYAFIVLFHFLEGSF